MKKTIMLIGVLMTLLLSVGILAAKANAEEGVAFAGLNLQGDTLFSLSSKQLTVGIGMDIATIKDGLIALRVEAAAGMSGESTKYGGGLTVNLPKLVNMAGGTWAAKMFNPSVGLIGLYDFSASKLEPALMITIIKLEM